MSPSNVGPEHPQSVLRRQVGRNSVYPIGFGAMLLSIEGRPVDDVAEQTIRAAVESGMTVFDSADAYHATASDRGHSEALLARVLRTYPRDGLVVMTKGGKVRPGDGSWQIDGRPEHLLRSAKASAGRLGVDTIDLYQLHAPDPAVPLVESLEALRQLVSDGVIAEVGVSNVSVDELDLAHRVLGPSLVSVQNQFSPTAQQSRDVLVRTEELGLAFLAWRPLGRILAEQDAAAIDSTFGEVARRTSSSLAQVVLRWHLEQSPAIVPIPGSRRPSTAADSGAAAGLHLDADELALLDAYVPE